MRIFGLIPCSSYKTTLKKGQTQTNIKKKVNKKNKNKKPKKPTLHLIFQCLTVVCYVGLCLKECWHDPACSWPVLLCWFVSRRMLAWPACSWPVLLCWFVSRRMLAWPACSWPVLLCWFVCRRMLAWPACSRPVFFLNLVGVWNTVGMTSFCCAMAVLPWERTANVDSRSVWLVQNGLPGWFFFYNEHCWLYLVVFVVKPH